MQKTININKNPRTAKQIIAAKEGETRGDFNYSTIDGNTIFWDYRNFDGCACNPESAESITLHNGLHIYCELSI